MAINDILKVNINQRMFEAVVQNVLYWKVDSSDDNLTDQKALELAFISDLLPSWRAMQGNDLMINCMEIQKVFPGEAGAVFEMELNTTGALTGQLLPATNAALFKKINLVTGGVGKTGRIYIAGIRELDQNMGRVTDDEFALMQQFADTFESALTNPTNFSASPVWAVRNPLPPREIISTLSVDTLTPLPRIATQRRRRTPIRMVSGV